ncbi:hypothetical protein GCM10009630_29000 [Kribbella jejuensis]|uniref:PH (Pleckstrin Homology) domain-containing protein n=1 Tax=Kribbella jejuensis TaxID=236068 RepID=A0A542EPW7_9ACTN|nr:hypothetical protein [Kribbella jejuensis]TQJ17402.1 hypothetical protein FB475_1520 [Kribbella jejuensis]
MAVMGERLPEAWMVEWHRNGRVEFPLRRWSFMQYPFLFLLGPALMTLSRLPDMLADDVGRFFGYLSIAVYAVVLIVLAYTLITQRPYLIVDRSGIRQGRRSIAWTDVGSIGLIRGPRPVRQLPVHPKNIWANDLLLTRQHVNDLQTFKTWLEELLEEQRRSETVEKADDASDR